MDSMRAKGMLMVSELGGQKVFTLRQTGSLASALAR